jgi:dihydroorotase
MNLEIREPDDMHVHLRDRAVLALVLGHTAARFRRAVVMPNLDPPLVTVPEVLAYRERIRSLAAVHGPFEPWMTLYLHAGTQVDDIDAAVREPSLVGAKLYPQGVTTQSASGLLDPLALLPVYEAMAERGFPLLVHGEDPDPAADPFDREARFIDRILAPLCQRLPSLRIVFEHITTAQAVEFVRSESARMAATITPHHLLYDRRALFHGGLHPHLFCWPLPKTAADREALIDAATGGEACFFLGTDSAPHPRNRKESDCCPAGVYSAHAALEFYAGIFEERGCLGRLERFASENGARFYRRPLNSGQLVLEKVPWQVPVCYMVSRDYALVPLGAGETLAWSVTSRRAAP